MALGDIGPRPTFTQYDPLVDRLVPVAEPYVGLGGNPPVEVSPGRYVPTIEVTHTR